MKLYYEEDADLDLLKYKNIAVYGYGSQGHAHAQNLNDSGANVVVALREGSANWKAATASGLKVKTLEEAAHWADFHMILVPDEHQKDLYENYILPHLKPCAVLAFAHGFNVHFNEIQCPDFVDVVMIAPKSPGHLVRRTFVEGQGTPCLLAVHQDYTKNAKSIALSYAKAIGGTRAGVIETNFKDETETDLFGEQAVLCGGVSQLIKYGFETLTEAGYPKELAYFECLHEMKLLVDLFYEGGLNLMNFSVSNTAEFGGYKSGAKVIPESVKDNMKDVLKAVQDGSFAKDYLADAKHGQRELLKERHQLAEHDLEQVGEYLRSKMTWLKKTETKQEALVN